MAEVQPEAFVALEESLTARLMQTFSREVRPLIEEIAQEADAGNFQKASEMVRDIDLTPVAEENGEYIEMIGMAAVLFGAVQVAGDTDDTHFVKDKVKPEKLVNAVELAKAIIVKNGSDGLRKVADRLIAQEEVRREDAEDTEKAQKEGEEERPDWSKAFLAQMDGSGQMYNSVASNLHTSRLSAWGFTAEARAFGLTEFAVTEVLDNRTCPVCRRMHGKVFKVEHARQKLDRQLSVQDPDDLKNIAPFPKRDKESLKQLDEMTNDDIMQKGWDTPPYHPGCRGYLDRTEKVTTVPTDADIQAVADDIADLAATAEASGAAGAADEAGDAPDPKDLVGMDRDDLEDWGTDNYQKWVDNLDEAEVKAIRDYTGKDYDDVNKYLRNLDGVEDAGKATDLADKVSNALANASAPEDFQVVRGVSARALGLDGPDVSTADVAGGEMVDAGFMSTTAKPSTALHFMKQAGEDAMMLRITVPQGSKAAYLDHGPRASDGPVTGSMGEGEVLMQKGGRLRFESVTEETVEAGPSDVTVKVLNARLETTGETATKAETSVAKAEENWDKFVYTDAAQVQVTWPGGGS